MWLSIFSKRTPAAYFAYVLIVLVLLIIVMIDPILGYLNGQISLITRPYKILIPILSLLLSLFCIRVFSITDIFERATLWPGYIYILLLLNLVNQVTAFQALAHGALGILILYDMLKIQYNANAGKNCYNLGLYMGIAFIVDNEMLFAIPFLLFAITNLKPLNYKEYLLYFLGLTTPLYFLYAYSFLTSDFHIWNNLLPFYEWFQFENNLNLWQWIQWGITIVFMIIAISATFIQYNSLPVAIRRLSSAILYLIGALMVVTMVSGFSGFLIFYLAPAFAFFASMLMLKYSNKPSVELIHLIFVGIIISIQVLSSF